ncbi:MAG TPA: hypothetical protein VGK19_21475 [Capsulimonadaceae bacterium]|jgi:hypothetical protein
MKILKPFLLAVTMFVVGMAMTVAANAADVPTKRAPVQATGFGMKPPVTELIGTAYFAVLDLRSKPATPAATPSTTPMMMSRVPANTKVGASCEVYVTPTETQTPAK